MVIAPIRLRIRTVTFLVPPSLLLVILGGMGCNRGAALTPELLAQRHANGTVLTAEEEHELEQLPPKEHRKFMEAYEKIQMYKALHTVSDASMSEEHHKRVEAHSVWKVSSAAEFSKGARHVREGGSSNEFYFWRPAKGSSSYTLSIDANDAQDLHIYLKVTYVHGSQAVATDYAKFTYDDPDWDFEGAAVYTLAPRRDYDALRVTAVVRTKASNKRFTKSYSLSEARNDG